MKIRSAGSDDIGALCLLVDADRLPGQPPCGPERVAAALAGYSAADPWSRQELSGMRVVVAESPGGELLGAGAIARRPNGWRHLLWLHAREDRRALDRLLAALLRGVRRSAPVSAFYGATELSVGLEGLPRQARPVTHDALVARGFTGEERWLYLRATEPSPAPDVEFRRRGHDRDIRVEIAPGGPVVGGAELTLPAPGIGVIWWLEVDPAHRGKGHGRQLLRAARRVLAEAGVVETILFVDRDDPVGRDRAPALALYRSEGFSVVDRLWSYRRGEPPPDDAEGR